MMGHREEIYNMLCPSLCYSFSVVKFEPRRKIFLQRKTPPHTAKAREANKNR